MPRFSDYKPGEAVEVLVYGKFKTGKTFGALTFPRPNVMDFDHGIAVAMNPDFRKQHPNVDFEYEQFSERGLTSRGVPLTHNAFDDACLYFDKWMHKDRVDQFDTWIIDSGTTLAEAAMAKAIILLGSKELGIASKTHEQAKKTGLVYPKMQDYGSERSMVEQFIDMVKDSGKHVVFICHEKELTNDAGSVTAIVPLLTGKGAEAIPLKFDEVYRLRARKSGNDMKRLLQTQADGIATCGSRYGLPNESEWTFATIKKHLDSLSPVAKATPTAA